MYLTSHRVRTSTGESGINVFLHGPANCPQPPFDTIKTISLVADVNPGKILDSDCDIKPGGNLVLSYLDIVAADPIDMDVLQTALEEFLRKIVNTPLPVSLIIDGIGIRFGATYGLDDALSEEFKALVGRALVLLKK